MIKQENNHHSNNKYRFIPPSKLLKNHHDCTQPHQKQHHQSAHLTHDEHQQQMYLSSPSHYPATEAKKDHSSHIVDIPHLQYNCTFHPSPSAHTDCIEPKQGDCNKYQFMPINKINRQNKENMNVEHRKEKNQSLVKVYSRNSTLQLKNPPKYQLNLNHSHKISGFDDNKSQEEQSDPFAKIRKNGKQKKNNEKYRESIEKFNENWQQNTISHKQKQQQCDNKGYNSEFTQYQIRHLNKMVVYIEQLQKQSQIEKQENIVLKEQNTILVKQVEECNKKIEKYVKKIEQLSNKNKQNQEKIQQKVQSACYEHSLIIQSLSNFRIYVEKVIRSQQFKIKDLQKQLKMANKKQSIVKDQSIPSEPHKIIDDIGSPSFMEKFSQLSKGLQGITSVEQNTKNDEKWQQDDKMGSAEFRQFCEEEQEDFDEHGDNYDINWRKNNLVNDGKPSILLQLSRISESLQQSEVTEPEAHQQYYSFNKQCQNNVGHKDQSNNNTHQQLLEEIDRYLNTYESRHSQRKNPFSKI